MGARATTVTASALLALAAVGCAAPPSARDAAPAREGAPARPVPPAIASTPSVVAAGEASVGPADTAGRSDRRTPVVRTVERVGPAVVSISTEALVRNPYYADPLFEWFFGQQEQQPRRKYMPNSLGSGVIVDPKGYVVTNAHVLAAASRVTVTLLDGRAIEAEPVGSAAEFDLALLKLKEPGPYPSLDIGFDEDLYPGETVIAIGNPFGLQSTVTVGVLSGTHRRIESGGERYTDFLQSDAAINPGNSGGALLTINGDLIGINTQIDARGQNLGFAIPVARVRKVFDELVRFGAVQDVWLGLDAEALAARDVARRAGPGGGGLLVRSVMRDSPVERAGLLEGDVIVEIQGERVTDDEQWRTALSRVKVGDDVRLTAWRDGEQTRVTVRAERFPLERGAEIAWRELGLAFESASARGGDVLVVTDVRGGSMAERIGFRRGLVLLGVDGDRIERPEQLYRALIRRLPHGSLLLAVSDGRATYQVPIEL